MADAEKAPDLWERFRAWVFRRFGLPGLIGMACAAAAVFAWTQWDKVSNWAGIDAILELLSRESIPKADPQRFSVLVAKLNGDATDTLGKQIFEVLKEFPGVQTLPLDRKLASDGRLTEDDEIAAGEEARQHLERSGASVLIWGSVLDRDHRIAKLFLTPSSTTAQKGSSTGTQKGGQYQPEIGTTIRLPDVFWSDLAQVLRLLIASRDAEFRAKEGHYIADRLPPFIAGVRRLLDESRGRPGWDADSRGSTLVLLADALTTLGDHKGENARLEEAIEAYRTALQEWTRDLAPLQWARAQNNLGLALWRLGERESGTQRLGEAVDAYRAALQEYTRERVPLDWAMAQNNLGHALKTLGERESSTHRLEEAVAAYRAALQERTRERAPLQWAGTQNDLGNALERLGERESGTERLEEAVAAYRAALQERTRERAPLQWAGTQNNLGLALAMLGQREKGTYRLKEAVGAYRAALLERTREQVPLQWAMTQNNLGLALTSLGERESSTRRLKEAVAAYRAALHEYTRDRVPLDWAMTQNNLGLALTSLGERQSSTRRLEEAVDAYGAALVERTRERVPLDWAITQNNLGGTLRSLGERESGTERLQDAVQAHMSALEMFEVAEAEYYVTRTRTNLERAPRLLQGRRRADTTRADR